MLRLSSSLVRNQHPKIKLKKARKLKTFKMFRCTVFGAGPADDVRLDSLCRTLYPGTDDERAAVWSAGQPVDRSKELDLHRAGNASAAASTSLSAPVFHPTNLFAAMLL